MNFKLKPFQEEDIQTIEIMNGNCLNRSDCGLGKTLETLYYLEKYNQRAIIICPSNVKKGWEGELLKRFSVSSFVIDSSKDFENLTTEHRYIIVSYNLCNHFYKNAKLKKEFLQSGLYTSLVVDESHYIMTASSKRSRAVQTIAKYMKHRLLLSATPVLSSEENLYPQIKIIAPEIFKNKNHFINALEIQYDMWGKAIGMSEGGLNYLRKIMSKISFGRKKNEVSDQLPQKTRQMLWYKVKQKEYNEIIQESLCNPNPLVAVGIIRKALAEKMVSNTIKHVKETLKYNSNKIIVFTAYKKTAQLITDEFKDISILYTGDSTTKKRNELKKDFINDKNIKVMIATIQSCAFGVDGLQFVSDKMIFNDVTFVMGEIYQAEQRIYRIGLEFPVNTYFMGFEDTYHEKMYDILKEKFKLYEDIFDYKKNKNKNDISMDIFNEITGAKNGK